MAHKAGVLATRDLAWVAVDTMAQPKNMALLIDARLIHKAIGMLARLVRKQADPIAEFLPNGSYPASITRVIYEPICENALWPGPPYRAPQLRFIKLHQDSRVSGQREQ